MIFITAAVTTLVLSVLAKENHGLRHDTSHVLENDQHVKYVNDWNRDLQNESIYKDNVTKNLYHGNENADTFVDYEPEEESDRFDEFEGSGPGEGSGTFESTSTSVTDWTTETEGESSGDGTGTTDEEPNPETTDMSEETYTSTENNETTDESSTTEETTSNEDSSTTEFETSGTETSETLDSTSTQSDDASSTTETSSSSSSDDTSTQANCTDPTSSSHNPSPSPDQSSSTTIISSSTETPPVPGNRPEVEVNWDDNSLCVFVTMSIHISVRYESQSNSIETANFSVPNNANTSESDCFKVTMLWRDEARRVARDTRADFNNFTMTFDRGEDMFSISSISAFIHLDNYPDAKDASVSVTMNELSLFKYDMGVLFKCSEAETLEGYNGVIITMSDVEFKAMEKGQEDPQLEFNCKDLVVGNTVETAAIVLAVIAGVAAVVAFGFATTAFALRQKRRRERDVSHQNLVMNFT